MSNIAYIKHGSSPTQCTNLIFLQFYMFFQV